MDFLKAISPRTLPGVQELQRRDLLHRASDLAFEDQISDDDELPEDLEYHEGDQGKKLTVSSLFLISHFL